MTVVPTKSLKLQRPPRRRACQAMVTLNGGDMHTQKMYFASTSSWHKLFEPVSKICLQSSGWVYDLNYSRLSMVLLRSSFCDSLFQCLHIGKKTFLGATTLVKKLRRNHVWQFLTKDEESTSNVCFCISSHCDGSVCLPFVFSFEAVFSPDQFGLLQQLPFQIAGTIFIKEGKPTRWILCSSELSNRL